MKKNLNKLKNKAGRILLKSADFILWLLIGAFAYAVSLAPFVFGIIWGLMKTAFSNGIEAADAIVEKYE